VKCRLITLIGAELSQSVYCSALSDWQ